MDSELKEIVEAINNQTKKIENAINNLAGAIRSSDLDKQLEALSAPGAVPLQPTPLQAVLAPQPAPPQVAPSPEIPEIPRCAVHGDKVSTEPTKWANKVGSVFCLATLGMGGYCAWMVWAPEAYHYLLSFKPTDYVQASR